MRPSRSSSTCAADVGLGRENRLALGAAIGTPAAASSARATGWTGTLTATVSNPAVTSSGTTSDFGSTIVSGPGSVYLTARDVARHVFTKFDWLEAVQKPAVLAADIDAIVTSREVDRIAPTHGRVIEGAHNVERHREWMHAALMGEVER